VDWESKNPWKIAARGKTFAPPKRTLPGVYYMTYKKRVYSENRVRYPLKRVDWDPDGERNPQNRGKSKYVRISWDEATDILAKELLRIREKYGMSAVLSAADMHGEGKHVAPSHGCANRLFSLLGGYTVQMRNQDSWEGYSWGSKNVWGCEPVGELQPSGNLFPDIANNTELLLFWGCDPETTAVGFDGYMSSRLSYWLHSLGIKFVYVDPALNYSGVCQADKWTPLLPTTDAALSLAIAHVGRTEGTYDKEYVKTHVVGAEPFFDYVLGKAEDGVPKTPEWASEKCGVPEWTIKALARDWAKKVTSIAIGNGGPGIRGPFSTEPARLQSILLSMQGLGKPGRHQVKFLEWNLHTDVYPVPYQGKSIINVPHRAEIVRPPYTDDKETLEILRKQRELITGGGKDLDSEANMKKQAEIKKGRYRLNELAGSIQELAELCKTTEIPPQQSIPKCMVHDAILKDKIEWYGLYSFCGPAAEQWIKHEFPAPGCSRLHMIWTDSPCMVTCWNDGFSFVKALRSPEIECVVAQHPWLENDCYLADIILPVATKFEMEDICDDTGGGIFTSIFTNTGLSPRGRVKKRFRMHRRGGKEDQRGCVSGVYPATKKPSPASSSVLAGLGRGASGYGRRVPPKRYFCVCRPIRIFRKGRGDQPLCEDPETTPVHAHRKAGVHLHGAPEILPNDPSAPVSQVDREERPATTSACPASCAEEVSAFVHVQSRPLAVPREPGRHHMEPRDRHHEGSGKGRLPVRAGLAPPVHGEGARHRARRYRKGIQRARHRPGRGVSHGAAHPRGRLRGPRVPV
jgi:trimethylamine-N-oxide reductase (cytochrome c)